jgi:hypothetical protein
MLSVRLLSSSYFIGAAFFVDVQNAECRNVECQMSNAEMSKLIVYVGFKVYIDITNSLPYPNLCWRNPGEAVKGGAINPILLHYLLFFLLSTMYISLHACFTNELGKVLLVTMRSKKSCYFT